jgi:hypothetical protein
MMSLIEQVPAIVLDGVFGKGANDIVLNCLCRRIMHVKVNGLSSINGRKYPNTQFGTSSHPRRT